MRLPFASFLFAATFVYAATAQSNTTAGLAGVGAGAALGASGAGQSGTTPSSAGGGGNTPVEIQIMVFQGMKEIAGEIAALTASYETGCKKAVEKDAKMQAVNQDRADLNLYLNKLEKDRKAVNERRDARETESQKLAADQLVVEQDEEKLAATKTALNIDLNALTNDAKKVCSVLLEDSTSANQMALYQATQGYYGELQALEHKLQPYFSLQIQPSLSFTIDPDLPLSIPGVITVTNTGNQPRKIKEIIVSGSARFDVDITKCDFKILNAPSPNNICAVTVVFPRDGMQTDPDKSYSATISIQSGDPVSDDNDTVQLVQLSGTVVSSKEQQAEKQPAVRRPAGQGKSSTTEKAVIPERYAAPADTGGGSGGSSSAGGSSTPIGLTYLGDLTTALGALKSNITYAAAGFQPTNQSFQILLEAELKAKGLFPYTSTSALNLQQATAALTDEFAQMLSWTNDINGWANLCKAPSGAAAQANSVSNTACAGPDVVAGLSVGQQLTSAYTTLITGANDGTGSPVIVSVLRGMILTSRAAEGMPSLQVTVAAAGGSTKSNSIFGVNLFYTFAPSYNAGVIATFELRDKDNVLLESGARNSLVAYGKWKSKGFHSRQMKDRGTCDSFCSIK
jgi:hypothetical protein